VKPVKLVKSFSHSKFQVAGYIGPEASQRTENCRKDSPLCPLSASQRGEYLYTHFALFTNQAAPPLWEKRAHIYAHIRISASLFFERGGRGVSSLPTDVYFGRRVESLYASTGEGAWRKLRNPDSYRERKWRK
jgi:hypothetical protein